MQVAFHTWPKVGVITMDLQRRTVDPEIVWIAHPRLAPRARDEVAAQAPRILRGLLPGLQPA
jgi:hypothetical protein